MIWAIRKRGGLDPHKRIGRAREVDGGGGGKTGKESESGRRR